MRTGIGQFVASVNSGTISAGAVVAPLDSDAWGESALNDTDSNLAGVVPAGARGGEGVSPQDVLILAENGSQEMTYGLEPSGAYIPGTTWIPSTNWIPGTTWIPENLDGVGVLVPNAEATMERMGIDELPEDAETVEQGETVEAENIIIATFGDEELYPEGTNHYPEGTNTGILPEEPPFPDEQLFTDNPLAPSLFDGGVQAPLGGVSFGMGVFSTPSAEVAGQDTNPLIDSASAELLNRNETTDLLSNAGISDAENVEWEAGPESVEIDEVEIDYEPPRLLGEETELELFAGVVSGGEAPWGVTLGIVRGTPDDHVIAIGVNRRPVGTDDGGLSAVRDDQHVINNMARMVVETAGSLETE
jgi:hypothetical protein